MEPESCVVTLETKMEKVLKVRQRWSKNERKTGNFGQPLPTGGGGHENRKF